MIANRELGLDDYLAICRRRLSVVLIPALLALVLGFLISFAITPKYTSRALLQVEGQVVPAGYVKPIITERVTDRMATLQQHVLSRNRLQPVVNRLGLATKGKTVDAAIEDIQNNVSVTPADASGTPLGSNFAKKRRFITGDDVPGFYVEFTANNARNAQQVCAEITSMLLQENLEIRTQVAQSTTDFLSRQLETAKRNLDDLDSKLAAFKKPRLGQLPDDVDNNLKILMGLNLQMEANAQTLNRAQQDKAFAESLQAQEIAAWKATQASPELPPLRQELVALENKLVTLQQRYTDVYPDVVKTKTDIAALKAKLKESDADSDKTPGPGNAGAKMEPAEILRLRLQIHQNEGAIARATQEQTRLQGEIEKYQGRLSLSPEVEQQYKQLTRDYETARTLYASLLTNKSQAEMQTEMERRQEGEQITLLNPADLPDSPSSPVRWMFAVGGLGAGLSIGLGIAMWLELRDNSIRDEADVMATLAIPMFASVPWVGAEPIGNGMIGRLRGRFRPAPAEAEKKTVGA